MCPSLSVPLLVPLEAWFFSERLCSFCIGAESSNGFSLKVLSKRQAQGLTILHPSGNHYLPSPFRQAILQMHTVQWVAAAAAIGIGEEKWSNWGGSWRRWAYSRPNSHKLTKMYLMNHHQCTPAIIRWYELWKGWFQREYILHTCTWG